MRWETSVRAAALLPALLVACAAQGQGCDRGHRDTTPANASIDFDAIAALTR